MTWYADEVIATASARVLRAVGSDPVLAPFAYHVTNPLEHEWHSAEVVHGLPENGLVVIRPVCDPTPDESPADWYGEPVLDWHSFDDQADSTVMIDRTQVAESCSISLEVLPPAGLLSYLKGLALETQSTFVFYSCSMWGGDVESEYAWIFGHSELVLVSLESETPGGPRPLAILEPSVPTRVVTGDALVFALRHLSLDLPTSFFVPHTRAFPWATYKLAGEPA